MPIFYALRENKVLLRFSFSMAGSSTVPYLKQRFFCPYTVQVNFVLGCTRLCHFVWTKSGQRYECSDETES